MPKFYYIGRNSKGVKETGVEDALTQENAVTKIQARGLIVVNVIPEGSEVFDSSKTGSIMKFKAKKKHGGVNSEDITMFCRQLSTLIGAGVTILMSLDMISKQVNSKKLFAVIKDLKKNMEGGLSYHEALALHPKIFSDLWVNLAESGEASGNLAVVLSRLASYLEKEAAFKGKVISALVYPAILMVAGTGALLFMTLKIIPTFAEIFKGFNITLPLLTQVIVNGSEFLSKNFITILLSIGGIIFAFKKYTKTKSGRLNLEKFQYKIPVLGEFFLALNVEKFSSEMGTLLESGVPILYALEITGRSVDNLIMSDVIRRIKEDVREGQPMRDSLERSGFFEPMVVQMVGIGEEIGELPQMFKRINSFYEEQCDTFLTRFVSMFEPLVLILMGGMIGVMVTAMFLPIFALTKLSG